MQKIKIIEFSVLTILLINNPLAQEITELKNKISLSGLIEIEYNKPSNKDGELTLSEVVLSANAKLTSKFDADIELLYEQDDEQDDAKIKIDVATLNGKILNDNYSFSVGRMYVPFGVYQSAFISDTVALEIGETQDEALALYADFENLSLAVWSAQNGEQIDYSKKNNNGVSLNYHQETFNLGIDWIENLVSFANTEKKINGLSIYGQLSLNNITLILERVSATEVVIQGEDKPTASQIELNYTIQDIILMASRQNVTNFDDIKSVSSIGIGYEFIENANITIEYAKTTSVIDDNKISAKLEYEW